MFVFYRDCLHLEVQGRSMTETVGGLHRHADAAHGSTNNTN